MNKKKLITFTPKMEEMVEQIQDYRGLCSFSAAVHSAIGDTYARMFPIYAQKVGKTLKTPEEKVAEKESFKQAKKDLEIKSQLSLLEKFEGWTTIDKTTGDLIAHYYTYDFKNRNEQKMPLEMLKPSYLKNQYNPDRETVEKIYKKGEAKYKL